MQQYENRTGYGLKVEWQRLISILAKENFTHLWVSVGALYILCSDYATVIVQRALSSSTIVLRLEINFKMMHRSHAHTHRFVKKA